jgi:hypothetical protein
MLRFGIKPVNFELLKSSCASLLESYSKNASCPLIFFEEQPNPDRQAHSSCHIARRPHKAASAGWDKLTVHLLESCKTRTVTAKAHKQPSAATQQTARQVDQLLHHRADATAFGWMANR